MPVEEIVESLTEQEWLDMPAEKLQALVRGAYRAAGPVGERLKRFIHGSWLGHPLHPILTDLPIGIWTSALIFDLIEMAGGGEAAGKAADQAIAAGEGLALVTAVAGATDWHVLNGRRTRRAGVAHALFNITATTLFGASLLARSRGLRGAGRALSFLGFGTLMAGGYLGGYLSLNLEVGSDHTSDVQTPKAFVPVMATADLAEGELHRANAGDTPLVLYRQDGQIHALVEKCAHLGGPLAEGHVEDGCLVCPWHASAFDLETGEVRGGPSAYPQPVLEVRVVEGQIEVKG